MTVQFRGKKSLFKKRHLRGACQRGLHLTSKVLTPWQRNFGMITIFDLDCKKNKAVFRPIVYDEYFIHFPTTKYICDLTTNKFAMSASS